MKGYNRILTEIDIHTFLRELGIAPTDTVLVHTLMRALGEVEGGCDGLIDAFCTYLTDGLFIVPPHTWASVLSDYYVLVDEGVVDMALFQPILKNWLDNGGAIDTSKMWY